MINMKGAESKINFNDIYTDDTEKCQTVLRQIIKMWDLVHGKNEMRTTTSEN